MSILLTLFTSQVIAKAALESNSAKIESPRILTIALAILDLFGVKEKG